MSAKAKTVLIVDDDEGMRDTLTAILKHDHDVLAVATADAALEVMRHRRVDLMLLDILLPGMSGIEFLPIVKEHHPFVEVIMISAINEVDTAVQAMRLGAYHYITKEFEYDALRSLVRNAGERQDLNRRVITLRAQVAEQNREFVTGRSKQVSDSLDIVHKVAGLSATILLLGQSGTGKELLARLIHRESEVADGPFIAVNLAAVPPELVESTLFGHERGAFTGAHRQQLGKFELASGGTLFLDEIGDLKLDLQAKLLRTLQEGEIERVGGTRPIRTDFRLIVATNVDLERGIKEGRFREDLFYRINVIPIRLPALRERLEDLPELAALFLRRYNAKFGKHVRGIADSTLKILTAYWWPGNIRELENLVERLVAIADRDWITDEDLPIDYQLAALDTASLKPGVSLLQEACDTFERAQLPPPRAREGRLERHGHRPPARHPAQHAQAQDEPAGDPRARQAAPRRLNRVKSLTEQPNV